MRRRVRHLVPAFVAMAAVASAFDARTCDLSKDDPNYVRVLSWNVFRQYPTGSAAQNAAFDRVLGAIAPDVICFQELPQATGTTDQALIAAVAARLNATVGGSWSINLGIPSASGVAGLNIRNGLASRWPLSQTFDDTVPASETRGVTMGLVDLPNATYTTDLFAMSIHFKSGGTSDDIARRAVASDAVAAWFGNLRTPGGAITLPANTPFVMAGDTNFNSAGDATGYNALLTGNITDNATYGPDVKGDWDLSDTTDPVPPSIPAYTFATHDFSSTSRLDRFVYSDSVAVAAQAFFIDTADMTAGQLATEGFQATDTTEEMTSDHRPVVVDLALGGVKPIGARNGAVYVTEFNADPSGSDSDREWFEVYNPALSPVDIDGWTIRSDGSGNLHFIDAPNGLVVPPRAHLVLGRSTDPQANGGVPVAYGYGASINLNNSAGDYIELYRGGVKIDGVRFNGGSAEFAPLNVDWGAGPQASGVSRIMTGDYRSRRTAQFGASVQQRPGPDLASPGICNDLSPCGDDAWTIR